MADAQYVVFAFSTPRERMQAVFLTNGGDPVATPGQDFVRISLMTDIPYQVIERRVIDVMQRHRQFNRTQARCEMSA